MLNEFEDRVRQEAGHFAGRVEIVIRLASLVFFAWLVAAVLVC